MFGLSAEALMTFGLGTLSLLLMIPGIIVFARGAKEADRLQERLERPDQNNAMPRVSRNEKSVSDAIIEFGKKIGPNNAEEQSKIKFKLMRAGFVSKNAVPTYLIIRLCSVVLPILIFLLMLPVYQAHFDVSPLIVGCGIVVLGFLAPEKFVSGRTSKREDEYRMGFPDMMDLLVACVEAGLSLDAGVTRVSEEIRDRYPNLAMHLNIIALELRAGRSRKDAWANFADRLGLAEAGALATMLRQSEEMGTSLGKTLRIFSTTMRERRMLRAEETALALPAKMTVPLIVFVFPTLLGVLVLPAIAKVLETTGG